MDNSTAFVEALKILAQSQPLLFAIILILIIVYLAPLGAFTFAIFELKSALNNISTDLRDLRQSVAKLINNEGGQQ